MLQSQRRTPLASAQKPSCPQNVLRTPLPPLRAGILELVHVSGLFSLQINHLEIPVDWNPTGIIPVDSFQNGWNRSGIGLELGIPCDRGMLFNRHDPPLGAFQYGWNRSGTGLELGIRHAHTRATINNWSQNSWAQKNPARLAASGVVV